MDALALLADAAGRNLVTDPAVEGQVSVRLRQIDPLQALEALAQAHGVSVEDAGGVLIARPATE